MAAGFFELNKQVAIKVTRIVHLEARTISHEDICESSSCVLRPQRWHRVAPLFVRAQKGDVSKLTPALLAVTLVYKQSETKSVDGKREKNRNTIYHRQRKFARRNPTSVIRFVISSEK